MYLEKVYSEMDYSAEVFVIRLVRGLRAGYSAVAGNFVKLSSVYRIRNFALSDVKPEKTLCYEGYFLLR